MLNPAFVAGPAINANLDARSRQLGPEISEYSSSFFDDYDEEDEFEIDHYEEESDEDFDESTLFEIAELLNSKDVPSKKSLLPTAREIIEDYDDEETDLSLVRIRILTARRMPPHLPSNCQFNHSQ